jgi:hypothetical protein
LPAITSVKLLVETLGAWDEFELLVITYVRPEEINAVKTMRRISLEDPCVFTDNGCLTSAAFFTAVLRGRGESLDSLTTVDFLTAGFFRVVVSSVAMLSPYGFTRTVYAL